MTNQKNTATLKEMLVVIKSIEKLLENIVVPSLCNHSRQGALNSQKHPVIQPQRRRQFLGALLADRSLAGLHA